MVCVAVLGALALHLAASECAMPSPGTGEAAVVAGVAEHAAGEDGLQVAAAADLSESEDLTAVGAAGMCAILLLAAVTWLTRRGGGPARRGRLLPRVRTPRRPIRQSHVRSWSPDRVALSVCRC